MTSQPGISDLPGKFKVKRPPDPLVSLIVPVFNEQDSITGFIDAAQTALNESRTRYEIIFVDDGSSDRTVSIVLEKAENDPAIQLIRLSRNFGKESALSAGIDHAVGDVLVPIDVDLQDPPEVIPHFLEKWREGFDVVYGIRRERYSDPFLKRNSANWFYKTFNILSKQKIPENAGDFRLIDRKVADALRNLPENNRFMKGLFSWVGFDSCGINYDRPERAMGKTSWSYWRLWNFALDGFTGFSTTPLRIWLYVGAIVSSLSFSLGMFMLLRVAIYGTDIPGYASLLTVVLFFGGVQLLSLGIIGEYLARLFVETKGRPAYIVDRVYRQCDTNHDSPAP